MQLHSILLSIVVSIEQSPGSLVFIPICVSLEKVPFGRQLLVDTQTKDETVKLNLLDRLTTGCILQDVVKTKKSTLRCFS